MVDGGGLAHLPRRLGVPVPVLQATLVGVEPARRQVERLAAGEVLVAVRRPPGGAIHCRLLGADRRRLAGAVRPRYMGYVGYVE